VKLTRLQEDVLHVVISNGPVTPRDVTYHLHWVSESSARGVLARLESRRLVDATYTYTGRRSLGRAYVARSSGGDS
jgi:hypothetical protein